MPQKLIWSESADAYLIRLRSEGATWDAIAKGLQLAPKKPKDHLMVINLSGRGDKDLDSVARHLGSKAQ